MQEHQNLLQTMLRLVNADLDFSLMKILAALVGNILSRQDVISYTSVKDLTSTRIQEEILLVILLCFLNLTLMHSYFQNPLLDQP